MSEALVIKKQSRQFFCDFSFYEISDFSEFI